jgi:hypothetical protein
MMWQPAVFEYQSSRRVGMLAIRTRSTISALIRATSSNHIRGFRCLSCSPDHSKCGTLMPPGQGLQTRKSITHLAVDGQQLHHLVSFSTDFNITALMSSEMWQCSNLATLSVLIALASATLVNDAQQQRSFQLSPYLFLGSKTPYYTPPDAGCGAEADMPPQCKLVHISHLGRHGSRHSTSAKKALRLRKLLATAEEVGALQPQGQRLLEWVNAFMEREAPALGHLAPHGYEEHSGIGQRMVQRHARDLATGLLEGRPLVFESTYKQRALASRDAFMHGFATAAAQQLEEALGADAVASDAPGRRALSALERIARHHSLNGSRITATASFGGSSAGFAHGHAGGPDAGAEGNAFDRSYGVADPDPHKVVLVAPAAGKDTVCDSDSPLDGALQGSPADPRPASPEGHYYAKLRYFDTCTSFLAFKEGKAWRAAFQEFTANAHLPGSAEAAFLRQIFTPGYLEHAGAAKGSEGACDAVDGVYQLCQLEASAHGIADRICSLFLPTGSGHLDGGSGVVADPSVAPGVGGSNGAADTAAAPNADPADVAFGDAVVDRTLHSLFDASAETGAGAAGHLHQRGLSSHQRHAPHARSRASHLDLLAKYEWLDDLGDWFQQGGGDPRAYAMSCVLLEDFITAAEEGSGLKDVEDEAGDAVRTGMDHYALKEAAAAGGTGAGAGGQGGAVGAGSSPHQRVLHSSDPEAEDGDGGGVVTVVDIDAVNDLPSTASSFGVGEGTAAIPADKATSFFDSVPDANLRAQRRKRAPLVSARFAHAETLSPLITMLQLYHSTREGPPASHPTEQTAAGGAGTAVSSDASPLHAYYQRHVSRGAEAMLQVVWDRLHAPQNASELLGPKAERRPQLRRDGEPSGCCEADGGSTSATCNKPGAGAGTGAWGVDSRLLRALKDPWSQARMTPMGANLQLLVYDCGDGSDRDGAAAASQAERREARTSETRAPAAKFATTPARMAGVWVRLLHNEVPVPFPPCNVPAPPGASPAWAAGPGSWNPYLTPGDQSEGSASSYARASLACPWTVVRNFYRGQVYAGLGISSCNAADWARLCEGVAAEECGA